MEEPIFSSSLVMGDSKPVRFIWRRRRLRAPSRSRRRRLRPDAACLGAHRPETSASFSGETAATRQRRPHARHPPRGRALTPGPREPRKPRKHKQRQHAPTTHPRTRTTSRARSRGRSRRHAHAQRLPDLRGSRDLCRDRDALHYERHELARRPRGLRLKLADRRLGRRMPSRLPCWKPARAAAEARGGGGRQRKPGPCAGHSIAHRRKLSLR